MTGDGGAVPIDGTRFDSSAFAPIAVATRNDVDESLHHGAAVVVDADGAVSVSVGDPEVPVYPRSSLKPFQADAMVEAGLDLPSELLAVVAASHSGEQRHLDAVLEILARHDLSVADLANTPDRPAGPTMRVAAIAAGVEPSPLQQNCSGKHAGMLATCRINGWPIDTYLERDHPLQQAITARIDALAGRSGGSVVDVGVDGCGAPTHVMPLVDVARSLGAMRRAGSIVTAAMSAAPSMVAGTDRDTTLWMQAVPGLVAKDGAAGVMVVGLPDGRAAALKIADGSDDVRRAVTPMLLRELGVDVDGEHRNVLDAVTVRMLGHGAPVGSVQPLPWH
ncbi:MAG: asparaginase [Ilumatobacter sp.]|uniref:asparaginase n=1 Tax=Ilumatobacter sp. TaxID=1967498 RepID=UPI00329900BB